MNPCPVTEEIGGYLLRCVMPAGHAGEHWAADLEPIDGWECRGSAYTESAEKPLGMGGLSVAEWENGGTNTDGPGRCANTVIPGPRRSTKEID